MRPTFITCLAMVALTVPALAQSIGERTGINSLTGTATKTADFVKEAAIGGMYEVEAAKNAANAEPVTVIQRVDRDRPAVDGCAVLAAEVFEHPRAFTPPQPRVLTGHARIVDGDRRRLVATNRHDVVISGDHDSCCAIRRWRGVRC